MVDPYIQHDDELLKFLFCFITHNIATGCYSSVKSANLNVSTRFPDLQLLEKSNILIWYVNYHLQR